MFRLQENVPEVYVKQSRDFQLFCRVFDTVNNSLRYNALSAQNLLNPLKVSDRLLPLLATRVGFFPKHEYNTYALREVISAFPYIVKYKGSKLGIEMALNVILKIENNYKGSLVRINNISHTVEIYTETRIKGEDLLRDVLSYILPIGYDINVSTYEYRDLSNYPTQVGLNSNNMQEVNKDSKDISIILSSDDLTSYDTQEKKDTIGSYTTTVVLKGEEIDG